MRLIYWEAMLIVANIIISVFTFCFCAIFIVKTVKHEHRRAWDYLMIAIIFFLGFQVSKMLKIFGILDTNILRLMFEIGFSCIFLYVFVFQRDLLRKYPFIKIEKKEALKKKSKARPKARAKRKVKNKR